MDIGAFSGDDFDAKQWINRTFQSEEARQNKDAFVSSLVMKLQLYVQQVNGTLEETSQSVLSSMPRVLRDAQLLQQEAQSLMDKMSTVKHEIANVEKNTAMSISTLEKLDKIKTELQAKKQGLHEADNWTVLANEVEEVFESGDIEVIANKLYSMQKCLSMLVNVPDYEDKKLQLEGLKNRLEAMASPKLVQAFSSGNLEQSKLYVSIFDKMDRIPQLLKYHHNCLKVSLSQEWQKVIEMNQDENVTQWLHFYYDKLLSAWHEQVKWCTSLFKTFSIETLVDIFADLLRSLDPSILTCVDLALKQYPSSVHLSILMEIKQITKHFALNLYNAIDSAAGNKVPEKKLLSLAQAIYVSYVPFVAKYAVYETVQLNQQLNALQFNNEDLGESINLLSLSIAKVMAYANEANKRCMVFTEGCGYPGLLKALTTYFNNYVEKFKAEILKIDKRKVKHEDWNLFQVCLNLMKNIGIFLNQIEQFEKTLVLDISETNNKLQNQAEPIFNQYKKLLLTASGRAELDNLVASFQKEETTILDQISKSIHKLCSDLHSTTHDVIFSPIFTQLLLIQKAPAWTSDTLPRGADMPDYSYAPQEYITQVGQYLMTLPQHLEPFSLKDHPDLARALKAADPQYSPGVTDFTDVFLEIIAKKTCQMFQDHTLVLNDLNFSACKQLATDIDYLGNVLEELGLSLSENLQQMSQLLRLAPEDYQTGSTGCNARVVAAVRQMRNITSSG